jgi:DNA-binding IclR family transcriptional regulator
MLPAQLTPVLPLQDPPSSSSVPPSLPPTYTTAGTDQSWTVTRHIFAAAYPRSRIGSYVEAQTGEAHEIGSRKTKAEVEKQVEAIRERQYSAQLQGETESGHLWLAVNCYRRKRRQPAGVTRPQTGTTLITAHATGLHKEVGRQLLSAAHFLGT